MMFPIKVIFPAKMQVSFSDGSYPYHNFCMLNVNPNVWKNQYNVMRLFLRLSLVDLVETDM